MATMNVELVAVEHRVWSGEANFVSARTTVGDIGILPGHEPVLAQLQEAGVVRITGIEGGDSSRSGDTLTVAVHGGFLHVTAERVSILAESAEIGNDIDVSRARSALDRADTSDPEGAAAAARAQARLRAAEAE